MMQFESRIDVLNLEWCSFVSRDRTSASLVMNYLRLQGHNVKEGSVFKGYELIFRYKPKVLFISNSVGAVINLELIKFAKKVGIKCVTTYSEGVFEKNQIDNFVWGVNRENNLYEDMTYVWSTRSLALLRRKFPELTNYTAVSGAVGFDQYAIHPINPSHHIERSHEVIIGVGCWDFGLYDDRDYRSPSYCSDLTIDEVNRFLNDRDNFNTTLHDIIVANRNVLFILKEHPGVQLGHWASGIEGCDVYPNVKIVKNEISILECIEISDFWVTYESTTAMEAWLMGKPTCLLNPSGVNFPKRHNIHKGQINCRDFNELQEVIDYYVQFNELPVCQEKENKKKEIIRDYIEWDDGLNHVRLGNAIIDMCNNGSILMKVTICNFFSWRIIKQIIVWYVARISKRVNIKSTHKGISNRVDWSDIEVSNVSSEYCDLQREFYKKSNLDLNELRKIVAKT